MNTFSFLDTPVEYLKGVGPSRAETFRMEASVSTFGDLLSMFPYRYVDRTKILKISEVREDSSFVQIKGRITDVRTVGAARGKRLVAQFTDGTGTIELIWFQGIKWVIEKIKRDIEYIAFGRATVFNGQLNMVHPELELAIIQPSILTESFRPLYNTSEKMKARGLDSKALSKLILTMIQNERFRIDENLPQYVLERLRLLNRQDAFKNIHFPANHELLQKAQTRLKFEELFYIQLRLIQQKFIRTQKLAGHKFSQVGPFLNDFYHHYLKFELTGAQKRVIKEIRSDIGSGRQMNRLLQGDVGSGKTLVALMSMLIALDNGFQACLMAPTEILATQHFKTISKMLEGMNVKTSLLTGSTKKAARQEIAQGLQDGSLQILIGTHALLEENVKFSNLGFVVIDEQHRFGVAQRARMWEKNHITPHVLVMTATPIPRTLAMTVYGDLDISIIDEMPPGRKPIITKHFFETKRQQVYDFIRKIINEGQQIYIVYPLIEESETLDLKNLIEGFSHLKEVFPEPQYRLSMVHGRMKAAEKEAEMQRFLRKETHIMVATTVIEVGVDVPNASVMVIENAERFGLSQLHQLRGRVGRGADQSYCILMSDVKLSNESRKRLDTMVQTNDGFVIAETDLRLRGPGDVEGTRQSGVLDLKIADIIHDEKILKAARNLAIDIITEDPDLKKPEHTPVAGHMKHLSTRLENWGLIS